jgi:hemerythrin-like domain-containing protein
MLDEVLSYEPGDERMQDMAKKIEQALGIHVEIEEKHFYAKLRDRSEEQEQLVDVYEGFTEHEVAKHLIALLKSGRHEDEEFKAELQVLCESVKHHVKEEESTIFAIAREKMDKEELDEIGETLEKEKARLMARGTSAKAGGRSNGARSKARASTRSTTSRKKTTAAKKTTAKASRQRR